MIYIKPDSNIAKILAGKTRGYEAWYVRHILSNTNLYKIERDDT